MAYVFIREQGKYSYVYVKESRRNPKTGTVSSVVIEKHGNLQDCLKKDPLYIEKLKQRVEATNEAKRDNQVAEYERKAKELLSSPSKVSEVKRDLNVGAALIKSVWKELGLDSLFAAFERDAESDQPYSQLAFLLTAQRILNPCSKIQTFESRNSMIMKLPDVTDQNMVYRVLHRLAADKEAIVRRLNHSISKATERTFTAAFYDVTTYSFESRDEDALRAFGMSKDGKPGEVQVVLGLLIDEWGIPVNYELFPGNTSEFKTMIPVVEKLIKDYKIDKLVIVADRGLNSNENLLKLKELGLDFVIAQKVKNCSETFRESILDNENWDSFHYTHEGEITAKYKTLNTERTIYKTKVSEKTGKTYQTAEVLDVIPVRWVVTYSSSRAHKDLADLDRAEEKAREAIAKGYANNRGHGFKGFIKPPKGTGKPELDTEKLKEARTWAGYYAICTNIENLSNEEIVRIYRQLWSIEDCFRISKTTLETRPCYVWKKESIEGHFVSCYVALTLQKYLQYKLRRKLEESETTTEKVIEALRTAVVAPVPDSQVWYLRRYELNSLFDKMCAVFGLEALDPMEGAKGIRSKLKLKQLNIG